MKQILLFWLILLIFTECKQGNKVNVCQGPQDIVFLDTVHDFGTLPSGNPVDTFDFRFVNHTGTAMVVLATRTSCPCTKADYPHVPVEDGDTSYIRVIFDATGRGPERFSKTVSVTTSNSNEDYLLEITGEHP